VIALINPPLVSHQKDSHSSGIPYLPHGLAYLSAAFEARGIPHTVIDCFGEAPRQVTRQNEFLIAGLTPEQVRARIQERQVDAIVLYASSIFNSRSLFELATYLGPSCPNVPIILTENTQAVTGFSLLKVSDQIEKTPITHVVLGEPEAVLPDAIENIVARRPLEESHRKHIWSPGEATVGKVNATVADLDNLPFPNWKMLPIKNYWGLKCAHGPVSGRYLALLTSRGCPYPCGFCSVPIMNNRKWRMRSAENVVREIEHFKRELGVHEFHIEDVNPTIHEKRIEELATSLITRQLGIRWKIVSGTKMDNLSLNTLGLMARSGLDYISFSPESGSPEVLKKIKKPFNHAHALEQVKLLRRHGVQTQACFVLGFPGEEEADRKMTLAYSKKLVRAGLGELTYFIVTPMPGTPIEKQVPGTFEDLSQLTFSPAWRSDYPNLVQWRNRLYLWFFVMKALYMPGALIRSTLRALAGNYRLKMEMFPRRFLRTLWQGRIANPA